MSYLPTCRLRSTPALSVTFAFAVVSFRATVPETDEARATAVPRAARRRAGARAAGRVSLAHPLCRIRRAAQLRRAAAGCGGEASTRGSGPARRARDRRACRERGEAGGAGGIRRHRAGALCCGGR